MAALGILVAYLNIALLTLRQEQNQRAAPNPRPSPFASSANLVPDWKISTRLLSFLLDSRGPDDVLRRAAAGIGLLPHVAWTNLEDIPIHNDDIVPTQSEGENPGLLRMEIPTDLDGQKTRPSRQVLEVKVMDPSDLEGTALIQNLLALVEQVYSRELETAQLADAAYSDSLTGLWNRRGFDAFLDQALNRARRHGEEISLLLCDIDHFKEINDNLGHATGDQALEHVARTIQSVIRPCDLAGRVGGDEIAILLGRSNAQGAKRMAARLRTALIADNPLTMPLTLSIGIADMRTLDFGTDDPENSAAIQNPRQNPNQSPIQNPTPCTTPVESHREQLYLAADQALYISKRAGRDRAEVHPTCEEIQAANSDPTKGPDQRSYGLSVLDSSPDDNLQEA